MIYKKFGKRIFDIFILLILVPIFILPIILISIASLFFNGGNIFYWSDRVGKNGVIFSMPKFRTMKSDAPVVATHLLSDPKNFLTPLGVIYRKFSLDEIPQLWSVFLGQMTFVGPRPALYNQIDLINLRNDMGVNDLVPGITGLAQICGRDNLALEKKVAFDLEYARRMSFFFDIEILLKTIIKVARNSDISH